MSDITFSFIDSLRICPPVFALRTGLIPFTAALELASNAYRALW